MESLWNKMRLLVLELAENDFNQCSLGDVQYQIFQNSNAEMILSVRVFPTFHKTFLKIPCFVPSQTSIYSSIRSFT